MASLTEVAISTKRVFKISALLLVSFFVLKVSSKMFVSYWKAKNPPKPPPPAARFGPLPKFQFKDALTTADITFSLETPTSTLPALSDRANVYYSPYSKPNLLALEKARKQALLLGFTNPEKKLNEKQYQWQNNEDMTTLIMNIFDGTFNITYDWKQDTNLLTNRLSLNEETAKAAGQQFLARAGLMPDDIGGDNITTAFLTITGQELMPAPSQSEANLIQIDLYRNDIDSLPVKTMKRNEGVIQLILSGTNQPTNGLISLSFGYFPVDYGSKSDYPLRNTANLWSQFSAGGGYIISKMEEKPSQITIRRVYLGYLDTLQPQKFIQPVLFFEGDNSFLGFTPALDDSVFQ